MGFKFVILWTDVALWAMFGALIGYVTHVRRDANLLATWRKVAHDHAALSAGVVLLLFTLVTMLIMSVSFDGSGT